MDFMSKLGYGALVMVIGLFIVFLGLTILIGCVTLMGAIFKSITNKQKAKKEAAAKAAASVAAPAPAPAPTPAPVAEEPEEVDDPQLIAVIAAAIAAYDNSNKPLVVRKVRRVAGWNAAARQENVYRF